MDIFVRKLTKDDWKIYKDLRLQMLSEEPQAYSQTFEELSKRSDKEWMEKTTTDKSGVLTISVDNKLAGMCGLFYEGWDTVAVWGVFVKQQFRGMGFGRKLMEEIEKEIRKDKTVKSIQVSVTSSQIPAFELYKKLGYKVVSRIKDKTRYNGAPYDEILMEKKVLL